MAFISPSNKSTGDIVSAAHWNQDVVANVQAGVPDIFTAQGDLAYATAADTAARLAKGTGRQILRMNGGATAPEWGNVDPAVGYTMGATGNDRHVESGTGNTAGSVLAVTFANAFAAAPNVVAVSDQPNAVTVGAVTTTGCNVTINGGGNGAVWWIAEGAD